MKQSVSFKGFVENLNQAMGVSLPESWTSLSEIQLAQRFLERLNEYFFQTYKGIGTTTFNREELQYFSEFHKFWEAHHREILNAQIDKPQAQLAAQSLNIAIEKYGRSILSITHKTHGLSPQAIAQVRFFTANQDFREPPEDPFGRYLDDPGRFDAQEIASEPADFLAFLGITHLSQTDKRLDFARNAARFLLDKSITAFEIARYFGNDAVQIRNALVNTPNIGYGLKKANMFIRDMVELGVCAYSDPKRPPIPI